MHHLQETCHFAQSINEPSGKGAFEMYHSFLYYFVLVCNSKFLYKFLIHMHIVYPPPQKLHATAERFCPTGKYLTVYKILDQSIGYLVWGLIRIRLTVAQKDQHMPKNIACSYFALSISILGFLFPKSFVTRNQPNTEWSKA